MEQNKMKSLISLPIVAGTAIAGLTLVTGQAQGSNAWNTNSNSADIAGLAAVSAAQAAAQEAPEAKPKYYVEPTLKTPRAIDQPAEEAEVDRRFAPADLDQILSSGQSLDQRPTRAAPAAPAVAMAPAYRQMMPQQPAPQGAARGNAPAAATSPGFPNPYAYNNAPRFAQQYAPQYGQPNGYGSPYGPAGYPGGYGNGYGNGFPGGYTPYPGGQGGFPSMGGFPGMGSRNMNFSPFGFW